MASIEAFKVFERWGRSAEVLRPLVLGKQSHFGGSSPGPTPFRREGFSIAESGREGLPGGLHL